MLRFSVWMPPLLLCSSSGPGESTARPSTLREIVEPRGSTTGPASGCIPEPAASAEWPVPRDRQLIAQRQVG